MLLFIVALSLVLCLVMPGDLNLVAETNNEQTLQKTKIMGGQTEAEGKCKKSLNKTKLYVPNK
jgi:hypothetical protein